MRLLSLTAAALLAAILLIACNFTSSSVINPPLEVNPVSPSMSFLSAAKYLSNPSASTYLYTGKFDSYRNNLVLVGYVDQDGTLDAVIASIDATEHSINWSVTGSIGDDAMDVAVTSDAYYILGHSSKTTGGLFVTKLNPTDGSAVWVRSLGGSGAQGRAIAVAPDGNIIVAGDTGSDPFLLMKISPNGDLIWAKYSSDAQILGNAVAVNSSGRIAVAGNQAVAIFDQSGNLINAYSFAGTLPYFFIYDIVAVGDDFVLVGTDQVDSALVVIKIAQDGALRWSKKATQIGGTDSHGVGVAYYNGKLYILASQNVGLNAPQYVVVLDAASGNLVKAKYVGSLTTIDNGVPIYVANDSLLLTFTDSSSNSGVYMTMPSSLQQSPNDCAIFDDITADFTDAGASPDNTSITLYDYTTFNSETLTTTPIDFTVDKYCPLVN